MNDGINSFSELPLLYNYAPSKNPLSSFYIPLLTRAVSYDRAVGYWSSSEIAYAAQGLAHFIAGNGKMRLLVGAQLSQKDVDAITQGETIDSVIAKRILEDPGLSGAQAISSVPHKVIAWMIKENRLEIKVGVPYRDGKYLTQEESGKYFHTKHGLFVDALGNEVAFEGSNNSTTTGWQDNYETFKAFYSWDEEIWMRYGVETKQRFTELWESTNDPEWRALPLPEAVIRQLISIAPELDPIPVDQDLSNELDIRSIELLTALEQIPVERPWTAVGTAPATPLPHQANMVKRVVDTFPRGYLFADMVGMGKTIEIGLVLRELYLSGQAKRILLLVPASVLKQWQEELSEKIGIEVYRFGDGVFLDIMNRPVPIPKTTNPWSAFPIVLASSHLARRRDRRQQLIDAGPWDVVVVDEAHHARRKGSKPSDSANSLLQLLHAMRESESWKAIYLASATPMQMHAHEVWDLLELLDLPKMWGRSANDFLSYYEQLRLTPKDRSWDFLSAMLEDYFSDKEAVRDEKLESEIEKQLGFVGSDKVLKLGANSLAPQTVSSLTDQEVGAIDRWLKRHTPMRDRAFRNTRETMRIYQSMGLIPADVIIPRREVEDRFIALSPEEADLYDRIDNYISKYYDAYKNQGATQALGFIMTVYRRRLTSSFAAMRSSMRRRLDALENRQRLAALLDSDDQFDVEDSLLDPEDLDTNTELLRQEIDELKIFVRDLESMTGADTKAEELMKDVGKALLDYDSVVIFTQYTDTMNYLRDRFTLGSYTKIGCYSGDGGQIFDHTTGEWKHVAKGKIKEAFRNGEINILLGTDSMSEGLNLQTCGRVFQVEMPWNFARSEQRNGRCDRIGARYQTIKVTNYFYAGTVEERVYSGIKKDYTDFTDIVGAAQPVLADIEKTIEQLSLQNPKDRDAAIDQAISRLKHEIDDLAARPVEITDVGSTILEQPPVLESDFKPSDLKSLLLSLKTPLITFEKVDDNQYLLNISQANSEPLQSLVTWDRDFADSTKMEFLTFGSKSMNQIFSLIPHAQ